MKLGAKFLGFVLFFLSTGAFAGSLRDQAGIFSVDGVYQAQRLIGEVKEKSGEDINVDVYNKAPSLDYASWAYDHAPNTDGVYILISRNPGHLEVVVKNSRVFTPVDRQRMTDILLASFRSHAYDKGLTEALSFAEHKAEKAHLNVAPSRYSEAPVAVVTPPKHRSHHLILWALLFIILGFITYKIIKRYLDSETAGYEPPPTGGEPKPVYNGPGGSGATSTYATTSAAPVAPPPTYAAAAGPSVVVVNNTPAAPASHSSAAETFVAGAAGAAVGATLANALEHRREEAPRQEKPCYASEECAPESHTSGGDFDSGTSGGDFDSNDDSSSSSSGGDFDSGSSDSSSDSSSSSGDSSSGDF